MEYFLLTDSGTIYFMLREQLIKSNAGRKGFRWRSEEISRLEGLSDAVFGFAITLLVVSLEVPKSFTELMEAMRGFFAFAISFFFLYQIWYFQYKFFRHYGLQDMPTIILNGCLLFVVLFYVYPLKFLFSILVVLFRLAPAPEHAVYTITGEQWPTLMLIYSAGYVAVFTIFLLLHAHAYRKRAELDLSALEVFDTKESMAAHLVNMSVGVISICLAVSGRPSLAGMSYMLLGVFLTVHGMIAGRMRRKYNPVVTDHSGTRIAR